MKGLSELRSALDATGLAWEITDGSRHKKIKVAGRLIGIVPKKGFGLNSRRAALNVLSQIKRAGTA